MIGCVVIGRLIEKVCSDFCDWVPKDKIGWCEGSSCVLIGVPNLHEDPD